MTLRRCVATLSSALNDAVRQRRLTPNAAKYAAIPRPPKPQRICWTPAEAVTFLQHCADINDPLTELFEVLIGTGMRKGEALALHWNDVHLDDRVLFVRHTLSNVDNTTPVFTTPKTKTSQDWIGLSSRVINALHRQARRQHTQRLAAGQPRNCYDLVFCRDNGQPLRPEYVLHHFHKLSGAAGVPRIRVHDLRHLAATLMIASEVPLGVISKTMRHSTPLGHRQHLRPPRTTHRTPSPRRHGRNTQRRPSPSSLTKNNTRKGSIRMRPHCDHNRAKNETSGFTFR